MRLAGMSKSPGPSSTTGEPSLTRAGPMTRRAAMPVAVSGLSPIRRGSFTGQVIFPAGVTDDRHLAAGLQGHSSTRMMRRSSSRGTWRRLALRPAGLADDSGRVTIVDDDAVPRCRSIIPPWSKGILGRATSYSRSRMGGNQSERPVTVNYTTSARLGLGGRGLSAADGPVVLQPGHRRHRRPVPGNRRCPFAFPACGV